MPPEEEAEVWIFSSLQSPVFISSPSSLVISDLFFLQESSKKLQIVPPHIIHKSGIL